MTDHHIATLRFQEPDPSVPADERSLLSFPARKRTVEEQIELHDWRTAPDLVKGPRGLDVQGFTYVKHRSALTTREEWLTGTHIEDTYIAELEKLILEATGGSKAVVLNIVLRRKPVNQSEDPTFYLKRGCDFDVAVRQLPRDIVMVAGRDLAHSAEPAKMAHIDYSIDGLRDSARYCRHDIKAAAQEALDAEDADADKVPRYAVYSVWRPLNEVVKRDPLAVCDWRTVDPSRDLKLIDYRAPSDVTDSGEFLLNAWACMPPEHPIKQKWYFLPEQTPEDVLVIKFADTAAEGNPEVAAGCPHVSPSLAGGENEEMRESVEARVFVFW